MIKTWDIRENESFGLILTGISLDGDGISLKTNEDDLVSLYHCLHSYIYN